VHAELLVTVAALMADDVYKLMIMDGLMSHYRVDFVGEGLAVGVTGEGGCPNCAGTVMSIGACGGHSQPQGCRIPL
jgi:hypothetical protein